MRMIGNPSHFASSALSVALFQGERMVLPITGPHVIVENTNRYYYRERHVMKQAKPYDRPLQYFMRQCQIVQKGTGPPSDSEAANWADGTMTDWSIANQAHIKAYDRFKDKVMSTASVGASLAESKQSFSMIGRRCLQLVELGRLVRSRSVKGIREFLSEEVLTNRKLTSQERRTVNSVRDRSRDMAGNWLELHFGWTPMIGDIYDAIDVLSNPFEPLKVTASASASQSGTLPPSPWPNSSYLSSYEDRAVVRLGAEFRVTNPNLLLANRLGIVNPAAVAWELIPFSFFFDWIVNMNQWIQSATDFVGLELTNGFTSVLVNSQCAVDWTGPVMGPQHRAIYRRSNMVRSLGVQAPSLGIRSLKLPGWQRALTASSLLVQLFINPSVKR